MSNSIEQKRSLLVRIRITLVSILSFIVTTACSLSRVRPTPEPTCYTVISPTEPPTPEVLCYEMVIEATNTPTPTVTCYTATPSTFTSPLLTPTPTPTPEARHLLLDKLLTKDRFPQDIARQLKS
ncbi:MAG: hypothetical protein GY832_06445 [Chloroflexi bacterium]|nr:hypothetical protein [Chloroflexota bacterium]